MEPAISLIITKIPIQRNIKPRGCILYLLHLSAFME